VLERIIDCGTVYCERNLSVNCWVGNDFGMLNGGLGPKVVGAAVCFERYMNLERCVWTDSCVWI